MKNERLVVTLTALITLTSVMSVKAQKRIVLMPQWKAQAQFAGYYVAKEKGFYKEAGLEVDIVHPSGTQPAMSHLLNNECQATTLTLSQALEHVDKGTRLVNILQTSMNSALMIVSSHNVNPLTQIRARVGVWSSGFDQLVKCLDKKEGLRYQWVPAVNLISLFVADAIDATVAMSYNEYYQLMQTGRRLKESSIYRLRDHGYNIQGDGLYVTYDYYAKHKEQARKFAQASRRGWEWAAANPKETILIVNKYVKANFIATNHELQTLMLDEVLRLQIDQDTGKREFRLRRDMVEQASQMMLEGGILQREVKYEDLLPK